MKSSTRYRMLSVLYSDMDTGIHFLHDEPGLEYETFDDAQNDGWEFVQIVKGDGYPQLVMKKSEYPLVMRD